MTRVMVDSTHLGFPAALPVIKTLGLSGIVAVYDTGSPNIAATAADLAQIPAGMPVVFIDQGFTGSPNMHANVRDCENGAWSLSRAVDKTGWSPVGGRPTLYLGSPDTAQEAFNLGWRGDVWLVHPSAQAPSEPLPVPAGLNVVAEQWNFAHPDYDISIVYDGSWPNMANPTVVPTVPPGQWNDPKKWEWQQVQIIGRGLDNVLYTFEYHVKTGLWVRISSPVGTLFCLQHNHCPRLVVNSPRVYNEEAR